MHNYPSDIFCAILYLIKSGCQWRMLPADFPKWGIVRAAEPKVPVGDKIFKKSTKSA